MSCTLNCVLLWLHHSHLAKSQLWSNPTLYPLHTCTAIMNMTGEKCTTMLADLMLNSGLATSGVSLMLLDLRQTFSIFPLDLQSYFPIFTLGWRTCFLFHWEKWSNKKRTSVPGPITSLTLYLTIFSLAHSGLQLHWPLDVSGTFQALYCLKTFVIAPSFT